MTKISKQSLRVKSKKWISKLPKHVKMSISNKKFSSKNEDKLPMLPPSSDDDSYDELSPIEEEHCSSSNSGASDSSQRKYGSTFLGSSYSSVSSEVSSSKNLNEEYGTPTDHEFSDLEAKTESDSSGNSLKSIQSKTSCRALRNFHAIIDFDEIEVDDQHENEQGINTHNDASHEKETKDGELNNTIVESVTIIQHIAEVHGEFIEDTLVEVDEEVPFEAILSGFTERIRDDVNEGHHPNIYEISPSETVNELLSTIINMIGLNRSKTFMFVLMNLSLIAANANQLKHLLNSKERNLIFYISLSLLAASFFFQLLAKICSIISCGNYNSDYSEHFKRMECLRKFTTFLTYMIFCANVVLTGITFAEFF
ncbi:hypothetical protein ACKWTF_003759 [Chironomus riparius]